MRDYSKSWLWGLDPYVGAGLLAAFLFFVISSAVAFYNIEVFSDDARLVVHTHETLASLDQLLSTLKDAESGQRGFLLTGDESYLQPYNAALSEISAELADVQAKTAADGAQQLRAGALRQRVENKLGELRETIDLRRSKGLDAALAIVTSDRGKREMDGARAVVVQMKQSEASIRQQRLAEMDRSYETAVGSALSTGVVGLVLTAVLGLLIVRSARSRALQSWLQGGREGVAAAMLGDSRTDQLGQRLLKFLSDYLGAQVGAVFVRNAQTFTRAAVYGAPADAKIIDQFSPGDSLLGEAVAQSRAMVLRDIPENLMTVGSALVRGAPRQVVIAPSTADGVVNGVVELGFIGKLDENALALLESMSETIGVAVRAAQYRVELQNYLEETQRQAEELAAQSEELRVSNEELEEQSRALKESQARIENSQVELERINEHLEDQARILETQRDQLMVANRDVTAKATELEQASRFKSEFLANMSHELRTPLNSLLILAKLIADNADENLTDDQIRYAKTIYSSGNDLLVLINDILDLSKIEAGRLDIKAEPFAVTRFMDSIRQTFEPIATTKNLEFSVAVDSNCPRELTTDRLRLEQVVKNLLSNALKFTSQGSVALHIAGRSNGQVEFAVRDTGIGIAEDQQARVFEAFRQADGAINRKFGGTGLGLSISRELARLLGGDISLRSEPGRGSEFTLTVPAVIASTTAEAGPAEAPAPVAIPRPAPPRPAPAPTPPAPVIDDRERLAAGKRVLLIVEDDTSFARILSDFSHELDFQTLIAGTADEALRLAREQNPHAVVLDIGLPDGSGLSVLDQLKRDVRTRHIPVHVVSASENAQTALSLGAIGYLVKPANREDLVAALRKLESRLSDRLRRVLIVEDDPVQRDAVSRLLEAENVEIASAGTAEECLNRLKSETFDCMVLDLALPDASGYALLETLSREDAYAFPPVIVYTGRDLSAEEEQKLRRYSSSIIIKGAKSPERLLDEVTLFLHQVVAGLPEEKQKLLRRARNRDESLEGKRVLVVEDDVRNIYALTSVLEPTGVVVQIARNGQEAVDAIKQSADGAAAPIALVLMDWMMPVMDGLAATREIRRDLRLKKLPIIVLTAKAMQDDQERCLEAGANDYMSKPLDVDKLISLVRVWMPR